MLPCPIHLNKKAAGETNAPPASAKTLALTLIPAIKRMLMQQAVELLHEHVDVLELAVDGCEADVGHFVDRIELAHDDAADLAAVDLCVCCRAKLLLHLGDDYFQALDWHRALLACADEAAKNFIPAEFLAAAVFF